MSEDGIFAWATVLLIRAILLLRKASSAGDLYTGNYCDTEVFRAECPEGKVIVMETARYGRMRLGRCVELDLGYIGCASDVLISADGRCSGRRTCEIRVPDAYFESTRPCPKELKTYLEASYRCISVETVSVDYCKTHDDLKVTSSSGYLSSIVTSETPFCDGARHPWSITGRPGQHIILVLFDFGLDKANTGLGLFPRRQTTAREQMTSVPIVCPSYGLIKDNGRETPTPICGSKKRIHAIYRSTGNAVKIWMTPGSEATDTTYFVIKFQVIGCGDPVLPENVWFNRTMDGNGIITCRNGFTSSFRIDCQQDNTWSGSLINCSLPTSMIGHLAVTGAPFSLVVFLVILVALVVSATILILLKAFINYQSCRSLWIIRLTEDRETSVSRDT